MLRKYKKNEDASPELALGTVVATGECEGNIVASESVHNDQHNALKVRNIQQVKLEVFVHTLFFFLCSITFGL
jgi:cytoskeletal protein CcmA (bactofilin family)